jgi:ethanolamine ammonia-lyase small subunit
MELRQHTAARIALGRAGASLPTAEVLKFGLAHAQARDAVLTALDVPRMTSDLQSEGWETLGVASRAENRAAYLVRPDWGRRLNDESAATLASATSHAFDLVFVVSDGLSSIAVQRHAVPLLRALRPLLEGLHCAPIIVATQARVALADEVGELLGAKLAISLIGERPGLSSPDSLGAYLTFAPRVGRSDAERNCISNIRPQGLGHAEAALQIAALTKAALRMRVSGVELGFDPSKMLG